jgi:hypothetical protein
MMFTQAIFSEGTDIMFKEGIAERAVGQYPLSIPTSLAIESANGIHPEIPVETPPILKFDELWINLRTLHRNFIGSLDKLTAELIDGYEAADVVSEEMEHIQSIIQETAPNCQVRFYVSNYARMEQTYPKATIRRDNTVKQKHFTQTMTASIAKLLKDHEHQPYLSVFDRKLKHVGEGFPKVLIVTHIPYDLLSAKAFKELVLLESHTGSFKRRALWYTKFYNGKELVQIPFREDMLQIFGDNETFHPMDIRLRKEILDIANTYNWSQVTTTDRIRLSLENMKNHWALEQIKPLLKSE